MKTKNIQNSPTAILEKKFKTQINGYDPKEVDVFFDIVLEDYKKFIEKIEILEANIKFKTNLLKDKEDEIAKINEEKNNLLSQLNNNHNNLSNKEIMDRLRKLEEQNYKK